MDWKNQITKTPYLVLFIFLGAIGIGTASALITITLDGDVVITGDADLQGDLTCTNCIDSTDIGDNAVTPSELSRFGTASLSLTEQNSAGSEPCILGEVRLFASVLVPKGWVPAEGQVLEISQNTELFSLMGTTYGGDGQTDFHLPDLSEINPTSSSFNAGLNYAICTDGVFPGAENTIITGDLTVEGQADVIGAPIISTRSTSDGNTSNLVIQRTEGATAETPSFALSHRTSDKDLWLYGFDGSTFKNFVGFDFPNYQVSIPSHGDTLVVDAATDKVGIGTDSPSTELDVIGNVTISGDYNFNTNQNRTLFFSASSFSPKWTSQFNQNGFTMSNFTHKTIDGAEATAYAPVNGIPDGAIIKEFSCVYADGDAVNDFKMLCQLFKNDPDLGIGNTIFVVQNTTSGITGTQKITATSNFPENYIYDSSKFYYIAIHLDPTGSNCTFPFCAVYHAEIKYEISKAD